eukprot:PhF_6_TR25326/c1_g1_i1/m.35001
MAHTHPLDGDGVDAEFFKILLKQSNEDIDLHFVIPDTILFYSSASLWYYYDKRTRMVKKRNAKELDKSVVYNYMIRDVCRGHKGVAWSHARSNGIVCTFTSTRSTGIHGNDEVLFMNASELKSFLFDHHSERYGFLQKFVPSKGVYNEVVQCVWSPQMTFAIKRTNRIRINDRNVDSYTKAVTFEGPAHYCTETFCSEGMVTSLKLAIESFVKHFNSVEPRHEVSRMCVYFKSDPDDKLYLLYSSAMRIIETEWQSVSTVNSNIPMQLHLHEPAEDPPPATGNSSRVTKGMFRTPDKVTLKHATKEDLFKLIRKNRRQLQHQIFELQEKNRQQTIALERSLENRARGIATSPSDLSGFLDGHDLLTPNQQRSSAQNRGSMRTRSRQAQSYISTITDDSVSIPRASVSVVGSPTRASRSLRAGGHHHCHENVQIHYQKVIDAIVHSHELVALLRWEEEKHFIVHLENMTYLISEWVNDVRIELTSSRSAGGPPVIPSNYTFTVPEDLDELLHRRYSHVFRDLHATKLPQPNTYIVTVSDMPSIGIVYAVGRVIENSKESRDLGLKVIRQRLIKRCLQSDEHRKLFSELHNVVVQKEKMAERHQHFLHSVHGGVGRRGSRTTSSALQNH